MQHTWQKQRQKLTHNHARLYTHIKTEPQETQSHREFLLKVQIRNTLVVQKW